MADACYGFLTINFLFGLYLVILVWRRIRYLKFRNVAAERAFVEELQAKLKANDYAGVIEMCDYDFRALPRLVLVVMANRDLGFAQLRQLAAEGIQRDMIGDLEYRLSWIVTVIKSGPLLGLFGTVLGMMAAFGRIGTGEKVQPSQIADEISVALICTAMGLATAIPFGYVLASFSIKVRLLQESLASSMTKILEHFRPDTA